MSGCVRVCARACVRVVRVVCPSYCLSVHSCSGTAKKQAISGRAAATRRLAAKATPDAGAIPASAFGCGRSAKSEHHRRGRRRRTTRYKHRRRTEPPSKSNRPHESDERKHTKKNECHRDRITYNDVSPVSVWISMTETTPNHHVMSACLPCTYADEALPVAGTTC